MSTSDHQQAIALIKQGRFDEAEMRLRAALDACPDDARALRLLGTVCHLTHRPDDATVLLQRALEREPCNTSTLLNLGSVHLDEQRYDEARACFEGAVAIDADSPDGHFNLGLVAQRTGQLEDAQRHYDAALERDPGALDSAASRATQHGRQSGNLLFGERGPFEDFERVLWHAAHRYMETLGTDPRHPYLARPPQLDAVHCWGVVLQRSGYQAPHIHPRAWLSGVYYAELPEVVSQGGSQQGWIEFGAPPPELAFEPPAPTRRIQPREGLIVLFPSYFYHRTVPYHSDQERISIAFDFSPA